MYLCALCECMYVVGVCAGPQSVILVCQTVNVINCLTGFLLKTVLVIFHWQFILFCFCSLISFWLCTTVIGVVNQCPVTRGQEVEAGHYKQSPLCTKRVTSDTLFLLEFVRTLLTVSPPHPLIPSPFPSPANFPPPLSPSPFPLLPSSVCFCSLDSLSVPTSTLSLSNYSPSLS